MIPTSTIGVMYRREEDPAGLANAARRAEELGFDAFWVVEDCFYMGGISQAAIALASTSTIQVGIGINPGVAHNPAILAMEYATLARAFPGRLIGGIGHGVSEWMDQIGEKVASPLTAIEETTTAIRRLLRGERLTVDGRYVQLRDVVLDPPPSVVPDVMLGVMGEKSMRLAGQIADGVLLVEHSSPEYVRWCRDLVDEHRSEPAFVGVYAVTLIDEHDPAGALGTMRGVVADALAGGLNSVTSHASWAEEAQALINEGKQALLDAMPDAWVHDLTLAGSASDARATMDRLTEAGATSIILTPMPGWDLLTWMESAAALLRA